MRFHDMHCHLDFMANAEDVAADARAAGSLLFANTVTPDGWRIARERFAQFENVAVGFGMHPWWVDERTEPSDVVALLDEHDPRFIGEVGLDFGKSHRESAALQQAAFTTIARWAAERSGKVLSIHSVHAAAEVLDTLERTGSLRSCTCVFHWYTGPSDQLKRALDAGCYFSVGPRMLATRKGREYVKAIPAARLLLETDAPPEQGRSFSFAGLHEGLGEAAAAIADIKGKAALSAIEATSRALLRDGTV